MLAPIPRAAVRSARTVRIVRARPITRPNARFQSTASTQASQAANSGSGSAAVAGVAGGAAVLVAGYAWYSLSGAKTLVNSAHSAKSSFDSAFRKSTENMPEPNEAVQWLKETVSSYTKMIPGAQGYVDQAFKDIEKVQEKHGDEVNKIISNAYGELKDAAKAGASIEAVTQAWEVLQKAMKQIGELAKDAAGDILENHPQLKEKVGGNIDQLKQLGDQYGPEAKKQVDETWKQIQDIAKGGLSAESITKVQKLIKDKTEELKKYGEKAWQKGVEEAKPVLDKNPKVKEFLDKNKDKLQQGNLSEIWKKVQEVAKTGNTDDAMKFLNEQVQNAEKKAKDSGVPTSLSAVFGMFPGGEELGDKLKQLQQLYEKRGKDAEELVKSAVEDIKKVLQKKVEEGEKLKEKAKDDVKQ